MKSRRLCGLMVMMCMLGSGVCVAQDVEVPAGYRVSHIEVSSTEGEGAALAVHPLDDQVLYVSVGAWGPHKVVKVDLSQDPPVVSDFATGAFNIAGPDSEDNALDSRFATVGGLGVLHSGELIIVDNNEQPGIPGDTIFLARDLNDDGDACDIVLQDGGSTVPEIIELIEPINTMPGSGWGGFSGQQVEVDGDDNVYIVTTDGAGEGEVLRITDPLGTPQINVWCQGLDYGAGLAIDRDSRLLVGNSSWPTGAAIYVTRDLSDPADGDALDPGEMTVLSSSVTGIFDLAVSPENHIYLTNGQYVETMDTGGGTVGTFATFPTFTFLGDIVFSSRTKPFIPSHDEQHTMMIIADGNGDGRLTVIRVPGPTGVQETLWMRYE